MLSAYVSQLKRLLAWTSTQRRRSKRVAPVGLVAEHLESRHMLAADFGDAPEFYPTTLAENGASHDTVGPMLGATRTSEADGAHSADASGDSGDDGVTFGTIQVGATNQTATVTVTGGPAKLDAWIDFNGDGSWGGPGEQIFDSVDVVAGVNNLTFDVPSWAISGTTYARFRLSTAGDLGWVGAADDGEVEDYQVTIVAPPATVGIFSAQQVITTDADTATSVFAADLDGDGDLDILSASQGDNKIAWYENTGGGAFSTEKVISTAANGPYSVFAADLDGDGDLDALSASKDDGKIAWYENTGGGTFSAQRVITTSAVGAISVFAADLDGDGDLDVLSVSSTDSKIAWYENMGGGTFSAQQVIARISGPSSVFAADLDGDGDSDVLSTSRDKSSRGEIAWYENLGNGNFSTQQLITTAAPGANSVFAADLDGDGDLDVLSASLGDDKIAWYENTNPALDFGDAPAFYPTTLAENGAWHALSGPMLGATQTGELDGAHSADASGDSGDDGVSFGTIQVGATQQSVTVTVTGGTGKLDAWIDFNGDGSWGGPGEQIFDSVDVVAGVNNLTFDVPSWAISGTTYARFRLSTAGDLGWVGGAADGEVEDYQVTIVAPTATPGVFSAQQDITTEADFATSVFAADLDGDGDLDVLSASSSDDKIAWYENTGGGTFSAQIVISTQADGPQSVFAADLDGDGDLDVLSASGLDRKIAWYENTGSGTFSAQKLISTAAIGAISVYAADLDGDGDLDVLSASSIDNKIAWYENTGGGTFSAEKIITDAAAGAFFVHAADLDGDGDLDVLTTSLNDDTIAWYENTSGGTFSAKKVISTEADSPRSVFAADLDGDGDLDVLSASTDDNKIAWYENMGAGNFSAQKIISTAATFASSVFAADLDGDGDLDVISGSINDLKVAWYENTGGGTFSPQKVISAGISRPRSVIAADLDGDGDLDVLSASGNDDKIAWYENVAPGFTLSRTNVTVDESGTTETFTVVLTEQPLTDVVLNVSTSDSTEATIDLVTLTFTSANWNMPQTVTITGEDDNESDGDQTSTITISINAAASDDAFDGLAAQTLTVTTIDDDTTVGIVVSGAASGSDLLRILDGVTGELRGELQPFPGFLGGMNVALGDLNGDGIDEIIFGAGAGGGPHVRVFDGSTLNEISGPLGSFFAYDAGFTGGVSVAVGDVNHDTIPDVITGAGPGGGSHVKVFSGADGSLLMSFFAYDSGFTGGVFVAAGDIDADGHADVITGAGPGGGPHVKVFSGQTGGELMSFFAYDPAFTGGVRVASGDVNQDSHADVITAAGPGGGPHVRAFSGLDGSELASFFAYDPAFTGGVYVASTDYNDDGHDDIVTGAGPGGGPHVRILDGQTLADLTMGQGYYSFDSDATFGATVAGGSGARLSNLRLSGPTGSGAKPVTTEDLEIAASQAIDFWSQVGANVEKLTAANIASADLAGDLLGRAGGGWIVIDDDAAGHGWGLTEEDLLEGRVDLFTAVVHEFGHLLGLDDDATIAEVMAARLRPGVRTADWSEDLQKHFFDS